MDFYLSYYDCIKQPDMGGEKKVRLELQMKFNAKHSNDSDYLWNYWTLLFQYYYKTDGDKQSYGDFNELSIMLQNIVH